MKFILQKFHLREANFSSLAKIAQIVQLCPWLSKRFPSILGRKNVIEGKKIIYLFFIIIVYLCVWKRGRECVYEIERDEKKKKRNNKLYNKQEV